MDVEFEFGLAQNLERLFQRKGVETQTLRVVDALVVRQVRAQAIGTLVTGAQPGGLRAADRQVVRWPCVFTQTFGVEHQDSGCHRRPRPAGLCYPAPGPMRHQFGRLDPFAHPHTQHRLVHDAGVDAFEPVVPPAQRFLQKPDRRTRARHMRPAMGPGADQRFFGRAHVFDQRKNIARITVLPAADRIDRRRDARILFTHRTGLPVVIAALVLQPDPDRQGRVL